MKNVRALQIGLGPLGIKIGKYISENPKIETVAAVDLNPKLVGKDFGALIGNSPTGIVISDSLRKAIEETKPDIAILTTVSDLKRITGQIEDILNFKLPIVSTCEELSHPWNINPELSKQINTLALDAGVSVLGTGVNPGFLMDALPSFMTSVSKEVNFIQVNRFQNAAFRRIPFQKKIGAGLSLSKFEEKKIDGSLRHVGLTESMQFIAQRMGWKLDRTEDIITPVIANKQIQTEVMSIPKGFAMGVRQEGNAYVNGEKKISLVFQAAVGEPEPYDEVIIKGTPDITSKIMGGVNGDIATCAITLNVIPQLLRSQPGLKTMGDIPLSSFWG